MIMPTVKTRIFALGCLFALASAPAVQTLAQNGQYIYDVQDGEADIFGQLRYEKNVNGTGLVKLNTANPNDYQWVHDYGYQAGVTPITTAGTYVGSEYYAYETTLYANTLMPRAISVVNVNTGEYTAKREIENSTTEAPLILDEMTYDPKTNRIFGLHYDTSANKSYIYEIDRKTLDIALVATIDKVLFYTLAADNGSLYAVRKGGMKSYLSKIDISSINKTTKTCEYSDLGNTNIYLGDFSQTMEFDKTTHRLWWMAQTSDGNAYLVELNPQTGAQIKKEFIDNEMQLLGMGIPYQYVADGAPSYPRAFKATADAKGALSAQLSWTTPSVNYLGAKLSALTGTKVYRNDQLVYTSTETTQGKSVAWTDRPSTDGYYIYKVVPYNAAGDGVYKEFAAYVGEDLPGAPQNVTLTTHGGNAEITWAAPEKGQHGGYFDNASLKYNVVRMPDNKVVVEGTTSLRATDAVSVQKGYSYVVTAVNKKGVGASATSKTMSFGPEDSVPFTSPLTTQDDFDRWVTADKNNDGNTWTFYKPTQTTTYDRCDQNADDWLYTPALKFEKGKTYQVRYTYSSANWVTPDKHEQVMEQMKVWLCAEPIATGATKLIKETGEFHTASNIFLYGKDNFQTETTGSARIAFQACSEANHGQIYLKDVSIREYSTKDLSVQALTGSQLVNSQSQQTFTVDVRNEGSATVSDYRVLLLNADNNEVLGEAKGKAVAKDETVEVAVNWVPGAEGTIKVVAKVELAGDTYPADNVLATPLEVKISAADADKWLTLNTDNSWGWRFPFFMLDPYSQCQALFLEKEMQKKGIEITGMRFLYNGKNAEAYTFPARIGIKNTTRTDMLDEDGGNAMFDEDGFTTVFDGNITIQGNANDLELVVNLDKPYKYEGGNVIMKFECPLGTQYIKDSTKHPDWHMMEMDGNPHIAYCSGEDDGENVWGELLMPFISIAYKDNGAAGIFAIGGDKNGVTRSGDSLLFDECADEARLYSATGALVASAQRANALSVAGLAKGVYVLNLVKEGKVQSLKVII